MHGGHVQRLLPTPYAQKTSTLLKGFGTQPSDFQQLRSSGEGAFLVPPAHQRTRQAGVEPRDAGQQGHAGRVQVNAHLVHAILHHRLQRSRQFAWADIVLVLPHADGFGINFDQLRQRVLQATRDAGRTTQADVHVGQLLTGQLTGAVDRGPGFADHDFDGRFHARILCRQCLQALDQIGRQLIRFAACGAVANRDQVHVMRHAQMPQAVQGPFPIPPRFVWIDGVRGQQPSGVADHRHFDPGSNAGIQAHHHLWTRGRCQQQITHVVAKDLNGHLLCPFPQSSQQVPFGGEAELDTPGPGHASPDQIICRAALVGPLQMQGDASFGQTGLARFRLHGQGHAHIEQSQCASTQDGQRTVRGYLCKRFVVFKIISKFRDLRIIGIFSADQA